MKTELSHKDLVKLGMHETKQGRSLNEIEADFLDKGIKRKDSMNALKEIDYYRKKEELKAKKEAESKKQQVGKSADQKEAIQQTKEKSSFWVVFLVFLVLVGLALFYYFYNNKF